MYDFIRFSYFLPANVSKQEKHTYKKKQFRFPFYKTKSASIWPLFTCERVKNSYPLFKTHAQKIHLSTLSECKKRSW